MESEINSTNNPSYSLYNTQYKLQPRNNRSIRKGEQDEPTSLEKLSGKESNKLPLPDCWNWTAEEVADWIENAVGYPQYRECFLRNYITGRKLIVVDASTLPRLNIINFEHIKRITAAIRDLLNVESENWSRSISLPPREPETLFLIYKRPTGTIQDRITRTQIFKNVGYLLERPEPPRNMWDRTNYIKPEFPKEIVGLWRRRDSRIL